MEIRPTGDRKVLSKMHSIIFPVTIVADLEISPIDNDLPCERDLVLIRELSDLYSQEYQNSEKQIRRF